MSNTAIATQTLTNTMSISIIAIDNNNDTVTSQFSDEKRAVVSKLRYAPRISGMTTYFKRYNKNYYLDDFIRTNI